MLFLLLGFFGICGAPDPEEVVKNIVYAKYDPTNKDEDIKNGNFDVVELSTGECADLAAKYHHGGTVLDVLDDFKRCLDQLNMLRKKTLKAGQESAIANKKAYLQYRDVVDKANDLDLNVTLEESMAKQRRREASILLKTMREVENKRRNLFAPLWQSVGLWDGFKPDPRMDAESRNLPYVGGEAKRESTVDRLLGQLGAQESVKAKRFVDSNGKLAKQILQLEGEIHNGDLGSDEYKDKLRMLITLREVEDEQMEQQKHSTFEGLTLKEDTGKSGNYFVYINDIQDRQHALLWQKAGVEWARVNDNFADLLLKEMPEVGKEVTGQQMVRCRKAFGQKFDPAKLVGRYFRLNKQEAVSEGEPSERTYRWANVKGFRTAYPQADKIAKTIEDGTDVSMRTIKSLMKLPGCGPNIMRDLVKESYVNEVDKNGNVRSGTDYYWTAPGIAWVLTPPHNKMFAEIPTFVGQKLSDEEYDKLIHVYGSVKLIKQAFFDVTPSLLSKKPLASKDKDNFKIVDRWTAFGVRAVKESTGLIAPGGWPVAVQGTDREITQPKEHDPLTKDMSNLLMERYTQGREFFRNRGWLKPDAIPQRELTEAVKLQLVEAIKPDPRFIQQVHTEAIKEKIQQPAVVVKKEKPIAHAFALADYCGVYQDPKTGTIERPKAWSDLDPEEREDWEIVGYREDLWRSGKPLNQLGGKVTWSQLPETDFDDSDSRKTAAKRLLWGEQTWNDEMDRKFTGGEKAEGPESVCESVWVKQVANHPSLQKSGGIRQDMMQHGRRQEMGGIPDMYMHDSRQRGFDRGHGFEDRGHGSMRRSSDFDEEFMPSRNGFEDEFMSPSHQQRRGSSSGFDFEDFESPSHQQRRGSKGSSFEDDLGFSSHDFL